MASASQNIIVTKIIPPKPTASGANGSITATDTKGAITSSASAAAKGSVATTDTKGAFTSSASAPKPTASGAKDTKGAITSSASAAAKGSVATTDTKGAITSSASAAAKGSVATTDTKSAITSSASTDTKGTVTTSASAAGKRVLVYLGANNGGSLASIIDKYGVVYAFEALPENISALKSRFGHLPHVHIVWAAVNDTVEEEGGWTTFHVSSNNVSSSLGTFKNDWLSDHAGLHMTKDVRVPTLNLCKFCQKQGLTVIDDYVSDIQGADWMVLKTMETPYLANGWIKSIQTETTKDGKQNIYSSLPTNELQAFRKLLEPHGYKLAATGWGLLTSGTFQQVPDDWWEFDSLWTHP